MDNENAAIWFVDRHLAEGRGAKVAFREADGAKRSLTLWPALPRRPRGSPARSPATGCGARNAWR